MKRLSFVCARSYKTYKQSHAHVQTTLNTQTALLVRRPAAHRLPMQIRGQGCMRTMPKAQAGEVNKDDQGFPFCCCCQIFVAYACVLGIHVRFSLCMVCYHRDKRITMIFVVTPGMGFVFPIFIISAIVNRIIYRVQLVPMCDYTYFISLFSCFCYVLVYGIVSDESCHGGGAAAAVDFYTLSHCALFQILLQRMQSGSVTPRMVCVCVCVCVCCPRSCCGEYNQGQ